MRKVIFWPILFALVLTSCAPAQVATPAPSVTIALTATPQPSATPVPTATPTPTPTATPKPTPTPITTLPPEQVGSLEGVPDPSITNPELFDLTRSDAPIPQFVHAMEMGGIEVNPQEVVDNLQFQLLTGFDGQQYIIGAYHLDPDPQQQGETLEGPIPLIIAELGENGEWKWREATTRRLSDILRIRFGGMIENHNDNSLSSLITKNFNFVTITSAALYSPVNSRPDFTHTDYQLRYAQNLGYSANQIMVGPIISNIPPGFDQLSQSAAREWYENFIRTFMRRYRNRVNYYILVNEPHNLSQFNNKIPNYIELAYQIAREENPEAFLIFAQTANYDPRHGGGFVEQTATIGNSLYRRKLIDAVGIQGHIYHGGVRIPADNIDLIINTFSNYEPPIFITELDTYMEGVRGNIPLIQAEWYYNLVKACLATDRCAGINLWGTFPDRRSWLGENSYPTPWTSSYEKKPSYYLLTRALFESLLGK